MADVELVIKIPEEEYELCKKYDGHLGDHKAISCAIANGIPLPKGHGRLIDVSEYFKKDFGDARAFLDKASTIIEADTESEEEE